MCEISVHNEYFTSLSAGRCNTKNIWKIPWRALALDGSTQTLMGHPLHRGGEPSGRTETRINCRHLLEFGWAEITQFSLGWPIELVVLNLTVTESFSNKLIATDRSILASNVIGPFAFERRYRRDARVWKIWHFGIYKKQTRFSIAPLCVRACVRARACACV
jgi:hypothetical protein